MPTPARPVNNQSLVGRQLNVNTTAKVFLFFTTQSISLGHVTLNFTAVGTAGTMKFCIYASDGQSKVIADTTTPSISATGVNELAVTTPATLSAGYYYFAYVSVGTTDISISSIQPAGGVIDNVYELSGEPQTAGILTVTAGTLPTTFNPVSDITANSGTILVTRFDN